MKVICFLVFLSFKYCYYCQQCLKYDFDKSENISLWHVLVSEFSQLMEYHQEKRRSFAQWFAILIFENLYMSGDIHLLTSILRRNCYTEIYLKKLKIG